MLVEAARQQGRGISSTIFSSVHEAESVTKQAGALSDGEYSFQFVFFIHTQSPDVELTQRLWHIRQALFSKMCDWRHGSSEMCIHDCIVRPIALALADEYARDAIVIEDDWNDRLKIFSGVLNKADREESSRAHQDDTRPFSSNMWLYNRMRRMSDPLAMTSPPVRNHPSFASLTNAQSRD